MSTCQLAILSSKRPSECPSIEFALQGVDVRHAGIATHYIPSKLLPQVGRAGLLGTLMAGSWAALGR